MVFDLFAFPLAINVSLKSEETQPVQSLYLYPLCRDAFASQKYII